MEDVNTQPAADGLLGGEAAHSGPIVMELGDGNYFMNDIKQRGVVQDSSVPPPDEQAKLIEELEAEDISAGEQMYIVSSRWWGEWCAYTNYRSAAWDSNNAADDSDAGTCPQSIDNSDITGIDSEDDLRPGLEEDRDFVIVRGKSWDLLSEWYGGGPAIKRSAFVEGLAPNNKRPRVNPYPMKLEICWGGKPDDVKPMKAEQSETVGNVKERACKLFGLDSDKVEIWDFFHRSKYAKLEDKLDQTLEEARVLEGQDILLDDKAAPLEVEEKTSTSPIITSYPTRSPLNRMSSLHAEDYTVQRTDAKPGLAGLSNLGNTCFMNSSLQCLMHSVPIMSVFLSGQYEQDLNRTNPLGMKGLLATAFGSLMSNVWKSDVGTVCPKGFKARIAQFAPQFSGYQQHDSQEFLAFLLDGLHEDINRIQEKPYIEETDSEGVPDEQLAARAWQNYRLRNDSHIVDHFQGLYKSTLVCPQCSYSSVKFDPFMYLSLPLPESRVKQMTVVLVHADGAAMPREYGLEVPQTGTLKDLYIALARVAKLDMKSPEQQMVFAKMSVGGYFSSFETHEDPKTRLTELGRDSFTDRKTSLVYFYSQPEYGPTAEGNKRVLVVHRKAESKGKGSRFSAPMVLWLPLSETYDPQLHIISSDSDQRSSLGLGSPSSSRDTEFLVTTDAPIWEHVRRMMQPFLAVPSLRQQPPAAEDLAAAGDTAAMQQDEQQQQQRPDSADVSMAATSVLTSAVPEHSPAVSPQHATSQPTAAAADSAAPAWTAAQQQQSGAGGAAGASSSASPGSPAVAGTASKAGSEADGDENNSTWGSHGSDAVGNLSDQDLTGMDYELYELDSEPMAAAEGQLASSPDLVVEGAAIGVPAGASQQPAGPSGVSTPTGSKGSAVADLAPASGAVGTSAAADADPSVLDDGSLPELLVEEVTDGEADHAAAAVVQEMGLDADAGGAALVGAGGVPIQPLDLWGSQQQQVSQPAEADTIPTAPDTSASAADVHWPPYLLKLARDTNDYPTTFPSWTLNHSHPNQHHNCFVLDWDDSVSVTMPYADYHTAALAAVKQQQNQLQQQQPYDSSSAFWVPDLACCREDGVACPVEDVGSMTICGDYVMTALQQPEYDPSTQPIKAARSAPGGKSVGLEACVEAFLQPEQLSEADEWYCPKCKTHVQADKKLDLWSLPEVLVVHLKRFSYTRWNRDKLDTQVLFPLEQLDLSRYVLHQQEQPPIYDCYAVSNHYGGLGGGHYTAFGQMPNDKKWYCFDDSRVDEITPDGVQSRAAYVLFYRRRQQAQQDPPDLIDQLLQQHQQHLQHKQEQQRQQEQEQAAAASAAAAAASSGLGAAGANDTAAGMDTDAEPPPLGASSAAAGPSSPERGSGTGLWGSPAVPEARASTPVGGENNTPASPAVLFLSSRGAAAQHAAADTSTSTSSRGVKGAEDDGDSSDGSSSSRPRRGGTAAGAVGAADPGDSDRYLPLGAGLQAVAMVDRPARISDQNTDAVMEDRDV